jgi:hypothetical protein
VPSLLRLAAAASSFATISSTDVVVISGKYHSAR